MAIGICPRTLRRAGTSIGYFLLIVTLVALGCGETVSDSGKETDTDMGDGGDDTEPDDSASEAPPACLSDVDSTLADRDAEELFGIDHVPVFDIYLPADKWDSLQAHAVEEQYTEAQVCFEGRSIGEGMVGLRFKGSYGTLYGCFENGELVCPRLSMKLKFSEYDEAGRFFGLKHLIFNANRFDDTRMKERLAYEVYHDMGIIAPRASWAVVRVNGKSYGLYGMVEQIDGHFTADRWPDYPDGNVYKELWPTDTDPGTAIASLRTNEDTPDVSGFTAFAEAFAAADDADLLTVLGEYTDLEHWARYMAVDEAILSYDGVTYFWTDGVTFHNHNYYFYEDAPSHFTIVPWDVESTFWIDPEHAAPHWTAEPDDCSLTYEYWGGEAIAPGCDRVFKALNMDHTAWLAAMQELLDGPFAEDKMLDKIDRFVEFIGKEARAKETPTMQGSFDGSVGYLRDTIPELRARMEAFIAAEQ